MTTDVVVPAHDEAERIGPVLDAITASPAVGQVIVVADACTDGTAAIARQYGAWVVSISAHTKGTAMSAGLRYIGTEHVVFCDGDISGLRPGHLTILCDWPPLAGQLVGVRGRTAGGRAVAQLGAALPSISGERRLPSAFARSLQLAGGGYRVETAINAEVARAGLPHAQVILSGVSNPRKLGPIKTPAEWAQVAGAAVAYAPELARYVWTEASR